LQRAVLLYGKVAKRRKEIDRERRPVESGWRARWRNRAKFRKTFGRELEELEIYARDRIVEKVAAKVPLFQARLRALLHPRRARWLVQFSAGCPTRTAASAHPA